MANLGMLIWIYVLLTLLFGLICLFELFVILYIKRVLGVNYAKIRHVLKSVDLFFFLLVRLLFDQPQTKCYE